MPVKYTGIKYTGNIYGTGKRVGRDWEEREKRPEPAPLPFDNDQSLAAAYWELANHKRRRKWSGVESREWRQED